MAQFHGNVPVGGGNLPSVAVAERAINAKTSIGKSRILPLRVKLLEEVRRKRVHIFNVGPWPQTINTGSTGTFFVPGCPFGTEYVEMLTRDMDAHSPTYGQMIPPISVLQEEMVIKSEDEMTRLEEDGWLFACSMLRIARNARDPYRLTRFGLFPSLNEEPTAEELAAARAELVAHCQELVKWAGDTFVTDRKLFSRAVRPQVHFVAAKVLGRDNAVDSPWMLDANPVGRIKCKMCGRLCEPDVATCEAGHIVNAELYAELMAANEAILAATKPRTK